MSDQNPNAIQLSMDQLSAIQLEAATLAHGAASSFADVYKYAMVSQQIMNTLTPEVIKNVFLPLRNKDFGWREDVPGKYQLQELQDVFTSAILYGAIPANNEILIISGRFYPQKNFFTRKLVAMAPDLTDLILKPGKVVVAPNGGALVNYSATWVYKKQPMSMERTGDSAIPCRLNSGQGADAALGKAERKIKAAIYNRLTGSTFSEGEAEEIVVEGVPSASGVVVTEAGSSEPVKPAEPQPTQTQAVATKLKNTKQAKSDQAAATTATPSGPQPWEGGGEPTSKAQPTTQPSAPAASTVTPTNTPAPAQTTAIENKPQAAPATTVAATTTKQPTSPKFSGNGLGEVDEVTFKITAIKSAPEKKPPYRIVLEDKVTYWSNDVSKANTAKDLMGKGVPVLMEYTVDDENFAIVVDLNAADFGNGDGAPTEPENQQDFGG